MGDNEYVSEPTESVSVLESLGQMAIGKQAV